MTFRTMSTGAKRVLELMGDGKWHTPEEIIAASRQREGLRRMRDLRQWYNVEHRSIKGRKAWEYRLTNKTGEQVHRSISQA